MSTLSRLLQRSMKMPASFLRAKTLLLGLFSTITTAVVFCSGLLVGLIPVFRGTVSTHEQLCNYTGWRWMMMMQQFSFVAEALVWVVLETIQPGVGGKTDWH